jgi:hypothetical protein
MKGTILYGAQDIRFEERDEPQIIEPTDAILRLAATAGNNGISFLTLSFLSRS